MPKIVNTALKAKAGGLNLRGQGQGHKIWPRGASKPRPGLEDYITATLLFSNLRTRLSKTYSSNE